jgi:methyl-accepting chemotaxis protein
VLDAAGGVFAVYGRGGAAAVPAGGGRPGHRFDRAGLELARDIVLGEERLGRVYLRRDLDDLAQRLRYDAAVLGLVFVGSLVLAVVGTANLQRALIRPVRELTQTVDAVTARRDYSLQARKLSNDEFGVLTDQFNAMLGEVRRRDEELRQAQGQLERRVEERTRELQQRTDEVERFNRAAVGRELRMVELKRQVNELALAAGRPPAYAVEEPEGVDRRLAAG